MRLRCQDTDEQFRAELVGWLEEHAPPRELLDSEKLSSAWMPDWVRDWQRTLFDAGWLVPGWPAGARRAQRAAAQQMIYFEEISRRETHPQRGTRRASASSPRR